MRLYIIRHADPDYENDTITATGRIEAQALAERLTGERLDRIYSSPLGRARATAEYTLKATGKACEILDWTSEIADFTLTLNPYGQMAAWDLPGEVLFQQSERANLDGWCALDFSDGVRVRDKRADIAAQSDAFFRQFGFVREGNVYHVTQMNREKIAVFCHGGFGLTWISHLLRLPTLLVWTAFWLPPTSITTILFEERSAEMAVPRCIGMADTAHLFAKGLAVLPRGLHGNYY